MTSSAISGRSAPSTDRAVVARSSWPSAIRLTTVERGQSLRAAGDPELGRRRCSERRRHGSRTRTRWANTVSPSAIDAHHSGEPIAAADQLVEIPKSRSRRQRSAGIPEPSSDIEDHALGGGGRAEPSCDRDDVVVGAHRRVVGQHELAHAGALARSRPRPRRFRARTRPRVPTPHARTVRPARARRRRPRVPGSRRRSRRARRARTRTSRRRRARGNPNVRPPLCSTSRASTSNAPNWCLPGSNATCVHAPRRPSGADREMRRRHRPAEHCDADHPARAARPATRASSRSSAGRNGRPCT